MKSLGRTTEQEAQQFVTNNPTARLGSITGDGSRRVVTAAKSDSFNELRAKFELIAIAGPVGENRIDVSSDPPPCVHRGSQRKTCCGAPDMWICKELKTDCVSDESAAKRLIGMVATPEASAIKVCSTCHHRKDPEPPVVPWPARTTISHRVGFLSTAYMTIGGTETFHRSLLPRLKSAVDVAGFVATAYHNGDGSKLQVPYATGVESAKRLAAHCDTVVVWGIHNLASIMPANRPHVIAVHHADWSSEWNNNLILSQLDLIDEIICVNKDTSEKLAACGKPTHYIPNAIDPIRIAASGQQSALRELHSIPIDSKIVLFGHRLSLEKRPELAVEIARSLPEDWVMVIAGDGEELNSVISLAAGCDNVRIIGAVESLADWLSISDCFLSLSTFEGFGLSIGEAMAAGLPTVSTHAGIAPGLATTLPTDSTAKEWADAVVKATPIITPAEILERFSVQRMVDSWASVIKKLNATV